MTDANTICHDLDLLDDWLAGKGYGEEAGLVLRALSLIHEQAEENEKLRAELQKDFNAMRVFERYRELEAEIEKLNLELNDKDAKIVAQALENVKLRAALKPFAIDVDDYDFMDDQDEVGVAVGDLRAAAAALKETGDD